MDSLADAVRRKSWIDDGVNDDEQRQRFLRYYTQEESAMKFTVTITRDEDGMFISECPSIPGCVSQGRTEEEAQRNIKDAIKECLEVRAEKGMPLTVTTRQVEVVV